MALQNCMDSLNVLLSIPTSSHLAYLVLALEAMLTTVIIWKVPFTNVDWESYMAQVDLVLQGEYDYQQIHGPTGPIAYPAGFCWFYGVFRRMALDVWQVQIVFAGLYLATMLVLKEIYRKADAPLWAFALCMLSKRSHSVFVLRLFNDAVAQFFCYAALLLLLNGRHLRSALAYSLAVSIKMQPLLVCPVMGLCLVLEGGWHRAASCISAMLALQMFLAQPYLQVNWWGYLARSFGGPGDLQHAWSVNWRFLPELWFQSRGFALALLLAHVALLLLFAEFRWIPGGFLSKRIRRWKSEVKLDPGMVVSTWFSCNFIGVACLRTMHFQFVVWYFHTVPFLGAWALRRFSPLLRCLATALLTAMVELPFLLTSSGHVRGPDGRFWRTQGVPTAYGSLLLQLAHGLLLALLVAAPRAKIFNKAPAAFRLLGSSLERARVKIPPAKPDAASPITPEPQLGRKAHGRGVAYLLTFFQGRHGLIVLNWSAVSRVTDSTQAVQATDLLPEFGYQKGQVFVAEHTCMKRLKATAQSASAALALFGMAFNAEVNLVLNPQLQLEEYPLKRYYREAADVALPHGDVVSLPKYLLYTGELPAELDPKPDSSERRELQTVLGMLVLADRFQVPGFGEVFEPRLRQLIRFDSSMATGLMTCTGLGLPWNTEYKQCLAKASSAAANPKNIEVDDALQQVEERVLQHIPADTIKGLAARAWVFYLLAAKIQLSMKGKKEAEWYAGRKFSQTGDPYQSSQKPLAWPGTHWTHSGLPTNPAVGRGTAEFALSTQPLGFATGAIGGFDRSAVEGQAMILGDEGWPVATAKGMQFEITGKGALEASDDTIVMGNLGYFQVRGNPGFYGASLKPGSSNETFELVTSEDLENEESPMRHGLRSVRRFGASTRGDFATTSLRGAGRLDPGRRKRAWREDCTRVWGNLYDYSLARYVDNHSPVIIRCPRHGTFTLRPRDHVQRRFGCPKCGSSLPGSMQETAAVLGRERAPPRLGQHVLRSSTVAAQIAALALPEANTGGAASAAPRWVAEIGVGAGALTAALLRRAECRGVFGFELDDQILQKGLRPGGALHRASVEVLDLQAARLEASPLRRAWPEPKSRCVVFKGNVLDAGSLPGQCQVVVGNLPYRISSALVRKLLLQDPPLERLVLMVQEEFAQRLLARPGSPKWGRLSALVAASCKFDEAAEESLGAAAVLRVGPEHFQPPPKVESAVVLLQPKATPPVHLPSLERLLRLLDAPGAKALALETALAEAEDLELPPRWRLSLAQRRLDPTAPVASLELEHFVALAQVSSYITPPAQLRVKMRPGKSHEDLFAEEANAGNAGNAAVRLRASEEEASARSSVLAPSASRGSWALYSRQPGVVASGHLYEKLLGIMILSVRNTTQNPLHFWFIDNFLSPSFKAFIPLMAERYDFKYDFVTYKWPSWLNPQSEKQRLIWAYKILFLDVLFPQDVPKIIFIDADQVVRADVKELWELDLKGNVYGFVPMGDSNPDTEGFRFWKQGYWKSHLGEKRYHISALFVVDLVEFRRTSIGETLRGVYNQLSRDPNSLANLDQDLPNFAQHQVPIFTLPTEWLWCETWCSQETKKHAKTIDLCQNPLTKEPKIVMAKRIISEWQTYHDEVQRLQEQFQSAAVPTSGKAEL
ncbi:unnamed protein product [Effrenium voratum]|nr:unnamed protein product [Effrenium voratum]